MKRAEGVKIWIDFKGRPDGTCWSTDCGCEEKGGVEDDHEAFGLSRKNEAGESVGGAGLGEDWQLSLRPVQFETSLRPLSEDSELQVAGYRGLTFSGQD